MDSFLNQNNITCIIPFYNEEEWRLRIMVLSFLAIPEITQIIIIDDGSEKKDVFISMIEQFTDTRSVSILRLNCNFGKSYAVFYALNKAYNKNILLADSDLEDIRIFEFKNAIKKFKENSLDMLILKRENSLLLLKFLRSNTLLSGERIIKKNHLSKILKTGVKGFQLEVAINQYFIDKKLENKCDWSSSSVINNYKFKKYSFFIGIYKDCKMYYNLIKYVGLRKYINQIFSFCK